MGKYQKIYSSTNIFIFLIKTFKIQLFLPQNTIKL